MRRWAYGLGAFVFAWYAVIAATTSISEAAFAYLTFGMLLVAHDNESEQA